RGPLSSESARAGFGDTRLHGRVRKLWQSGLVESQVKIVGSTPTSATFRSRGPAVTTPGRHPGERWFESIRDQSKAEGGVRKAEVAACAPSYFRLPPSEFAGLQSQIQRLALARATFTTSRIIASNV